MRSSHTSSIGPAAWIAEQLAAPISGYPPMQLWPSTAPATCDSICVRDNYSMYPLQRRFFINALYGGDQLRQRVAFALHQMFVVSGRDITLPSWMAPYLQILDRNAFGNFRQLLYDITLNPAMGRYLDMVTSTRTNPNENYAREILQLFSIGTDMLNLDGTPQLDVDGEPLPSYDQAVVDGFSKVFTGWSLAANAAPGRAELHRPDGARRRQPRPDRQAAAQRGHPAGGPDRGPGPERGAGQHLLPPQRRTLHRPSTSSSSSSRAIRARPTSPASRRSSTTTARARGATSARSSSGLMDDRKPATTPLRTPTPDT